MATGSPRQFSIRSLLMLTAIIAADLAWLRNQSDHGIVVAVTFGVHVLMFAIVWLCYWICSLIANRSDLYRVFLGWLSTTLAGACFTSMYLPMLGGTTRSLPPEEALRAFGMLVGLGILGGIVAGVPAIAFTGIADMVAWFSSPRFQGRAQATLSGVLTAVSVLSLLFASEAPRSLMRSSIAGSIGFALAICYPFGRLWDRAAPLPRLTQTRILDQYLTQATEPNEPEPEHTQ